MQTKQVVLKVDGMHCSACPVTVQRSLTQVAGVQDAQVTLDPPQAVVSYDPNKVSADAMVQAVTKAGYSATVAKGPDTAGCCEIPAPDVKQSPTTSPGSSPS